VPAEQRYCLEQALSANPESQQARAGLPRFAHAPSVRPAVLGVEMIEAPLDIAPSPIATATQPLVPLQRSRWAVTLITTIVGMALIGLGIALFVPAVRTTLGISLGADIQATVQAAVQATAQAQQVAVSVNATQEASEACGSAALTTYADAMSEEIKTFEAQISVAQSTPRMSLGTPLQRLVDIQTETRRMKMPACLKSYHERVMSMMELYRLAFETFAAQGSESITQAALSTGGTELGVVREQLDSIRDGTVPPTPSPAVPTTTPT